MRIRPSLAVLTLAISAVGCNNSGLNGGSTTVAGAKGPGKAPGSGSDGTIAMNSFDQMLPGAKETSGGDKIIEIETPFEVKNGTINISFDAAFRMRGQERKTTRPLGVVFVLDETASMETVFSTMTSGVRQFVANLATKKLAVKLGLITFKDVVSPAQGPLDIDSFVSAIASKKPEDGDDGNEASMLAFEQALKFSFEKMPKDAVKAILNITDQPGHDGQPLPRNCKTDKVIAAVNALPQDQRDLTKIFYSVDSKPGVRCDNFLSAREQWDHIFKSVLPDIPENRRGGSLPYPFNGEVLLNNFGNLIETTIPGDDLICVISDGELEIDGNKIGQFSNKNLKRIYQDYVQKKPYIWSGAIPSHLVQKYAMSENAYAHLSSCCMLQSAIDGDDFSQCEERQKLSIKFKFKVK